MGKSEATKNHLFTVAMDLFGRQGFVKTTMRQIAAEAKMAPGAIYYYYESKESLIFDFYQQSHTAHVAAVREEFDRDRDFGRRLKRALASKIEVADPYKDMSRALFRVAANPESPLSPFSQESRKLRLEALAVFEEVIAGSDTNFNDDIKSLLPEYLWLYQMGIILFWIYDTSSDSRRTYDLIDNTVPLVVQLNKLIQSPLATPFRKKILAVLTKFRPNLKNKEIET